MVRSTQLTIAASMRMYIALTSLLFAGLGCAATSNVMKQLTPGDWVADYDTAEARVRESGQPLLIYYKGNHHRTRDPIRAALDEPGMSEPLAGFVRCTLFQAYEPDRRYVAQFGVERAPALIVVHRDGTYHATSGHLTSSKMASFVAGAKQPGKTSIHDPYIPRQPRYDWLSSMDAAELAMIQSDRPILAVYARRFSNDWRKVRSLLDRPEIGRRLSGAIHCRIDVGTPLTETTITPFGALKLPAVAIARPDGSFETLELPTSADEFVRFVDRALAAPHEVSAGGAATSEHAASQP